MSGRSARVRRYNVQRGNLVHTTYTRGGDLEVRVLGGIGGGYGRQAGRQGGRAGRAGGRGRGGGLVTSDRHTTESAERRPSADGACGLGLMVGLDGRARKHDGRRRG